MPTPVLPDGFELTDAPSPAQSSAPPAVKLPPGFDLVDAPTAAPEVTPTLPSPGASLPFAKEMSAGANAALDWATSGKLGEPYGASLARQRAQAAADRRAYPMLGLAGDIGAAATLPVPPVAQGTTALGRIGQGIGVGTGYGAIYGAANGKPTIEGRAEGAAEGAAGGALWGGLFGAAGESINAGRQMFSGRGRQGAYAKATDALADAPQGTTPVEQLADQYVTGTAPGNTTNRRRAFDILGEEMERANGDMNAAIPNVVNRISQESGVTPQTARQHLRELARVNENSPLMFGESQTVAASDTAMRGPAGGRINPTNVDLEDLGRVQESALANQVDYLANNGNAQSATVARNAVRARQPQLADYMRRTFETLPSTRAVNGNMIGGTPQIGNRAANIVDTTDMVEAATAAGQAEYGAAYRAPTNNSMLLNWLPRLLQRYDNMAATRSGDYARAMRRAADQFQLTLPNGQRLAMGTLQQLQDARGSIRGQMDGYSAQGRDDLARVIRPLYDQVTRLMERANPTWGAANQRWADMKFMEMGQGLGDTFAKGAGPRYRQQLQEYNNLAPEAQDIVRVHFLQKMQDEIDNARKTGTTSLAKLYLTDHARNAIRNLFGNEATVEFVRAVRNLKSAEMTGGSLANSATHRRQQTQKQMDQETGLMAAVEHASVGGARNAIMNWVATRINESRNRPLADILTTRLADTPQVARHVYNMRQAEQRAAQLAQPPQWTGSGIRSGVAGAASLLGTAPPAKPSKPPPRPSGVPGGSMYSASRNQWKDGSGTLYDATGRRVQ